MFRTRDVLTSWNGWFGFLRISAYSAAMTHSTRECG